MATTSHEVESVFNTALSHTDAAARAAYLDTACGDDSALRVRVETLLDAHESARGFLDTPLVDANATVATHQLSEKPGEVIGRYKLLQIIGEGGFGAVYMAEQAEPVRRKVALKIIKPGMDTRQVIARFEAERQALALMDHPHIARVLDAGATDTGRPFFVMELVHGIPITEYCDQHRLTTRQRLELFIFVCHAVQHAHQKGIIHRDIKPNNVLVTLHDSVAVPKVIDFGIAKATNQILTEKTLFTEFRQFIGTPEYMSPDQAGISGLDVDTRTDIYSMGVLLYELLTGTTPFDTKTLRAATYAELQRIIREDDPEKPSKRIGTLIEKGSKVSFLRQAEPAALSRLIRGDLDWIVMRAMEKDRTRRYQTAGDFAADVQRHLADRPVQAGPPRLAYSLSKFVRRNRAAVLLGSVIFAAFAIGLIRETMFYYQAIEKRDAARAAEVRAVEAMKRADEEAARSKTIADFLQDMLASTDPSEAVGLDVDVAAVVATARDVFGKDHATVAATLGSLAVQLQSAGNLDAAEPLHRESLRIWKQLHGETHANVEAALARLGVLFRLKGDDDAAERALRDSLAIAHALPDGLTLNASGTQLQLAEVLQNRGVYDEAEALIRESIRIRRRIAPHQRVQIASSFNLLLRALLVAGKSKEAAAAATEAMSVWRHVLPERGLSLASLATQFAGIHLQQGNLDEAEALYTEALNIYRVIEERPLRFIRGAIGGVVEVHNQRDDDSQAFVPTRMKLVQLARDILAPDEPYLGEVLMDHAAYLRDRDRPAEALRMGAEGLALLYRIDPQDTSLDKWFWRLQDLAWKLASDPSRSPEEYRAAMESVQFCLERNPDSFAVVNTLGILHYRLGDLETALETLARSDAHYSKEREGGTPHDIAFIAMAHHRLGHEAAAQEAMDRLRMVMQIPRNAEDELNQGFLAEAEALVRPAETPSRANAD